MAIEYKKIIFMGMKKPSDKCLLVSIPMKMYRIQTNKFTSGLNYFQKAVLKLKFMPAMTDEKISSLLHLNFHLVRIIVSQLEDMKLITSTGFLTPKGEQLRNNADDLVVEDIEKQIGYVFVYDSGKELFPYYQQNVQYAEINDNELFYQTNRGAKSVSLPFEIYEKEANSVLVPKVEEVLQLIKNTSYREKEECDDYEQQNNELLNVRFIPDNKPIDVLVCTYIYLPESEDDNTYSDDWMVQDPFGHGDSYELKLYLESQKKNNKPFSSVLFNTFKDVVTENNRKFDESETWFENLVQERIDLLFGQEKYQMMDANIQLSIKEVVDYYMKMERHDFSCISHSQKQMFFLNMQSALETILKQDQKDREEAYTDIDNNYEYASQEDRQFCLRAVFRKRILSDTKFVPRVILNKKTKSWKGRSLLDYLMKFIMSLAVEPNLEDCQIIGVFKNRIDTIVSIAELRNHVGHGATEDESRNNNFSGDDAKEYFQFMTDLINDYLKTIA